MAFPFTKGPGSCRPTSLTALQRKREEEVEAKPSAQAAALSHPSRICFKDIEVSRGCDLLHGQVSFPKSPEARGGGAHVLTLLS